MPARNKKPNGPEKRHDTGLIAPGKKVVKEKPVAQLNGNAAHKTSPTAPANLAEDSAGRTPPVAEDDLDARFNHHQGIARLSRSATGSSSREDSDVQAVAGTDADGDADSPVLEGFRNVTMPTANGSINKTDGNLNSSVDLVTTVIGPHSHWDVLAILLVLLQLPQVLLVLVQSSFAFMTFGNTANPWSIFTLSSAPDWFRSHGGNPSAVVSILADVGFTCAWLLSPILKDFVLDLAPAVVALSLGGATAAQDSWRHGATCIVTVFFGHIFQERRRRQYLMNMVWTVTSKLSFSHLPFVPAAQSLVPNSPRAARSWARIILELHIVTHGLVRVIRRWIDRSTQSNTGRATSKVDADVTAATLAHLSTNTPGEVTPEVARNASTDGRPPGPAPPTREKPSISSGKKRRKQATLVRSQQPFWAAIATTKIQVSKEIEQSHAERDNFEADATTITNLGDAKTKSLDDRVWLTHVYDTEIWFTAALLKDTESTSNTLDNPTSPPRRGSQESALINVHVNGAFWSSVDSQQISGESMGDGSLGARTELEGKIFGLTASTNYLVEFVRLAEDKVIYSTSLLTRPVASTGQGTNLVSGTAEAKLTSSQASNISTQTQDPLRPSSPTTTLKKSIEAAESKLSDHKNRSNKARKGRQNATKNLRQEFSDLSKNVASGGPNERQHQRQLQYRQNIKQAEESVAELAEQIAKLGDIPEADVKVFEDNKSTYTDTIARRDASRKKLEASKREGQRKANEAYSENAKIRTKREKTESRLASLMDRRKATAEENDARRNAKVQSETQHAYKIEHYRNAERNLVRELRLWDSQRMEFDGKTAQLEQQKFFLECSVPQATPNDQIPLTHTPENASVGLVGGARPKSVLNSFPNNHYYYGIGNPVTGGMSNGQDQVLRQRTHARSSSMLSNISGFTDEETSPQRPEFSAPGHDIVRNGSGSPRDAVMPSPQRLSPIGTEFGKGSPRDAMKR